MMTMTDQQAADAMRAHHEAMATALRQRVAELGALVQARHDHVDAQSSVLGYLENDLLPHAMAEEKALYPAGDSGPTAMLVHAMRDEHRNLMAHVEAFRAATDAVQAVALSSAILALFDSHLSKENDLLVPAFVADQQIDLVELLGGMHELLGEAQSA